MYLPWFGIWYDFYLSRWLGFIPLPMKHISMHNTLDENNIQHKTMGNFIFIIKEYSPYSTPDVTHYAEDEWY